MRILLLCLLILTSLSSCDESQAFNSFDNQLLFIIEKRDVSNDEITEFRFYNDGLESKTIMHSSAKQEDLFKTSFLKNEADDKDKIIKISEELAQLDYHNSFPWKEDFYKRGDVYKVILLKEHKLDDESKIKSPSTYYFYSGHDDNPELFEKLAVIARRP